MQRSFSGFSHETGLWTQRRQRLSVQLGNWGDAVACPFTTAQNTDPRWFYRPESESRNLEFFFLNWDYLILDRHLFWEGPLVGNRKFSPYSPQTHEWIKHSHIIAAPPTQPTQPLAPLRPPGVLQPLIVKTALKVPKCSTWNIIHSQ